MGLGREFAIICAQRGLNLILVSLPGEGLDVLAKYLTCRYKIQTVYYELDLTQKEALFELHRMIRHRYPVNMMINNAGFGGSRPFETSPMDYLDNMIQLNIRAVSILIRLMIPELKHHERAWILNISSMAAFTPMPYKTVYPASKAFVYFLSRGLSEELKDSPISVSVVHPGPIMTNEEVRNRIRMHGTLAKICLVPPEKIAKMSLCEMLAGKKVIIPGILNKINWFVIKWLPVSVLLALSTRMVRSELSVIKRDSKDRITLPVSTTIRHSATAG